MLLRLSHWHAWDVSDEQQEPEQEPTRTAEENGPFEERGPVMTPRVPVVFVRERGDDDDEPFGKHTEVDENRDREQHGGIPTSGTAEEHQRRNGVAEDREPHQRAVRAGCPEQKLTALKRIAAIPGKEELAYIGVRDDQ